MLNNKRINPCKAKQMIETDKVYVRCRTLRASRLFVILTVYDEKNWNLATSLIGYKAALVVSPHFPSVLLIGSDVCNFV